MRLLQQLATARYFVDDHFLLEREAYRGICQGIDEQASRSSWGCERAVGLLEFIYRIFLDLFSTVQHLFPGLAKAHCRTIMFGIESGSQKVLDRLKKEPDARVRSRPPHDREERRHRDRPRFFVVGTPDEDRRRHARHVRLRVDAAPRYLGFNRLCVYRGRALAGVRARGLVDDLADWYKYFKCSEIDPTCLPGDVINAERAAVLRRLSLKVRHYPLQTLQLLRRFLRYMPLRDVVT